MSIINWDLEVDGLGAVEASRLGWRPGQWPNSFAADGTTWIKQSCTRYERSGHMGEVMWDMGEVLWVTYCAAGGAAVRVYND
jgi:hypothetical protein